MAVKQLTAGFEYLGPERREEAVTFGGTVA
jgi:hypothetical protein